MNHSWWKRFSQSTSVPKAQPSFQPTVEILEDRTNPAAFFPTSVEQLAQVLETANTNGQDDIIDLGNRTITLGNSLQSIGADSGHSLAIQNGTIQRDSSAGNFRILTIDGGADVTLDRLVVRGGNIEANGGGVFNAGTLTVLSSTITGNNAGGQLGGGIFNDTDGTITLIANSTISNNDAGTGGGIFNQGTITNITSSTLSINDADVGGGLANQGTIGSILNSTISGNTAETGGGLSNQGFISILANSTIARNTVTGQGGGIHNPGSIGTLSSSIVGDNTDDGTAPDLNNTGVIGIATDNLIEGTSGHQIANGNDGNLVGINPGLGALGNNGGPTFTHLLISGSPAIDAGSNDHGLSVDQRGYSTRIVNGEADIGAYEWGASAPPTVTPGDHVDLFAVGVDPGPGGTTDPRIRVFNADQTLRFEMQVFEQQFRGGVRVATADVTGDGVEDIIAGAGIGGGPRVRVFDGVTGNALDGLLGSFFAFDEISRSGIYVAGGDVNLDGHADVIVSQEVGGSPEVRVFSGADGSLITTFFAEEADFRGGIRVTAGDVNGDGRAEIITAPGFGIVTQVRIFEGANGTLLDSFQAFESGYTGGVFVSSGDVTGDGLADIIVSSGSQAQMTIGVYDSAVEEITASFDAYPDQEEKATGGSELDGVQITAVDTDGDGRMEILTTRTASTSPQEKVFDGLSLEELDDFFAFDSSTSTGTLGHTIG